MPLTAQLDRLKDVLSVPLPFEVALVELTPGGWMAMDSLDAKPLAETEILVPLEALVGVSEALGE